MGPIVPQANDSVDAEELLRVEAGVGAILSSISSDIRASEN